MTTLVTLRPRIAKTQRLSSQSKTAVRRRRLAAVYYVDKLFPRDENIAQNVGGEPVHRHASCSGVLRDVVGSDWAGLGLGPKFRCPLVRLKHGRHDSVPLASTCATCILHLEKMHVLQKLYLPVASASRA